MKTLKNILGFCLGYGTCMNCSESFMFKTETTLDYIVVPMNSPTGAVVYVKTGFMVCKECLDSPMGLDEEKIIKRMKKEEWDKKDINLAKLEIQKHNLGLPFKK